MSTVGVAKFVGHSIRVFVEDSSDAASGSVLFTPSPKRHITRSPQNTRGFTLIETIAAVVVLAVAIPPLLWAVQQGHHSRVDPVLSSRARWLAQEKLEDIIADRHSPARGYDSLDEANYPDENPIAGFSSFGREVTLTETEADLSTPGEGYMTVTVEVSWTDAANQPRSMRVSTVLTEYDS